MVVGEGKPLRITVILGCVRGREGGFGDERLWGITLQLRALAGPSVGGHFLAGTLLGGEGG